jgi:hypothetical protein
MTNPIRLDGAASGLGTSEASAGWKAGLRSTLMRSRAKGIEWLRGVGGVRMVGRLSTGSGETSELG